MDDSEISKPLWRVSPRNPGAVTVYHRFNEQPVILGRPANMPLTSEQEILDPLPLGVP